jgi:hypothetical protein
MAIGPCIFWRENFTAFFHRSALSRPVSLLCAPYIAYGSPFFATSCAVSGLSPPESGHDMLFHRIDHIIPI